MDGKWWIEPKRERRMAAAAARVETEGTTVVQGARVQRVDEAEPLMSNLIAPLLILYLTSDAAACSVARHVNLLRLLGSRLIDCDNDRWGIPKNVRSVATPTRPIVDR
jgi:hypothetical protein